jgi:hypothetical protein
VKLALKAQFSFQVNSITSSLATFFCSTWPSRSDECLNYATANRNEWENKGQEIVLEMVARYQKKKFVVAGIAKKRAPPRRAETSKPRVAKEA